MKNDTLSIKNDIKSRLCMIQGNGKLITQILLPFSNQIISLITIE